MGVGGVGGVRGVGGVVDNVHRMSVCGAKRTSASVFCWGNYLFKPFSRNWFGLRGCFLVRVFGHGLSLSVPPWLPFAQKNTHRRREGRPPPKKRHMLGVVDGILFGYWEAKDSPAFGAPLC